MDEKIPLICIAGPTASGKTGLAVALAKRLDGEVVSADSMQIYQQMNIGTAKPTLREQDGVPHHCLDLVPPDAVFSVADYVDAARKAITEIAARGKRPIVAGGTGLYLNCLCDNIEFTPMPADAELRGELETLAREQGNEPLWAMLKECDPVLAAGLHPNNRGRVIRALEVFRLTGVPMSEHQRRSRQTPSPYQLCLLGLTFRDRQTLYARIDRRVDDMLAAGLLDEVRGLQERGYSKTSVQAIGYKEFFDALDGKVSLEEAADAVRRESRRYAKRQLTWFRRDGRIHWLEVDAYESAAALAEQTMRVIEEVEQHPTAADSEAARAT